MGGTGKASGQSTGGGAGTLTRASSKALASASFQDKGFGTWEMDVSGAGGGQVLLNTNASGSFGMPGTNVYEAVAWDKNYAQIGGRRVFSTLATAKQNIKSAITNGNW